MTPADLKQLNIRHLQGVLERTIDPDTRARIVRFIAEERAKPASAYPAPWEEPD